MRRSDSRVVVFDAIRTPKARLRRDGGTFADIPAHELLAHVLRELVRRGTPTDRIDDVVIGTSTAFGEQGGDVARTALLWAGWPDGISAGVVSRLCCSGLDAIETGAAKVAAGSADIVVVGGVESMSRVPMLSDEPAFVTSTVLGDRTGYVTIGVSADLTATQYGFSRTDLDVSAVLSHRRAATAPLSESIVPVRGSDGVLLSADEGPRPDTTIEALAALRPLFGEDPSWERVERRLPGVTRPAVGLHTAATAPQPADAAAVAVLGTRSAAALFDQHPIAEVIGVAHAAVRSPLLTAPVVAAERALERAGITARQLDVIEANESFAASPLALIRDLALDPRKVNPNGGSMATGHPLGAGGGVLLVNALDQLRRVDGEHALITIPAALGLGSALVVRRLR
ncbi:thiolase family protein [Nocardia otitidiscaviarum]|uniref:thiolase family protein n=1 Tax=Nocardia otitidiscaviarum TaxID=1823 RepID=UPI0018962BDF|nr:thiolase family protein [Nocardia otitidiscaviarum]MBF6182179.1 thiolase family protein [Nocardia otitidiscaviarum]